MQSYASDNNGGLPAASINLNPAVVTWDIALAPYLKSHPTNGVSAYYKRQLLEAMRILVCPSDLIQRSTPRSYAMPERNMSYGWPPASDDKTGVGLWWDKNNVTALLGGDLVQSAGQRPELLPKLKLSILTDPAGTLLTTEFIAKNNTLGSLSCARLRDIKAQRAIPKSDDSHFHFGGFNYLMADGHVEWLTGMQTGEIGVTPAGIWTINPGD